MFGKRVAASDIRNSLDKSRQSIDSRLPRMIVEVMPGWDKRPEWIVTSFVSRWASRFCPEVCFRAGASVNSECRKM
jgi:hypothetical protein